MPGKNTFLAEVKNKCLLSPFSLHSLTTNSSHVVFLNILPSAFNWKPLQKQPDVLVILEGILVLVGTTTEQKRSPQTNFCSIRIVPGFMKIRFPAVWTAKPHEIRFFWDGSSPHAGEVWIGFKSDLSAGLLRQCSATNNDQRRQDGETSNNCWVKHGSLGQTSPSLCSPGATENFRTTTSYWKARCFKSAFSSNFHVEAHRYHDNKCRLAITELQIPFDHLTVRTGGLQDPILETSGIWVLCERGWMLSRRWLYVSAGAAIGWRPARVAPCLLSKAAGIGFSPSRPRQR